MSRHHAQIKNDPRWKAARASCIERDGACVDCGTTEDLQADHDPVPLWRCLADEDLVDLAFDVDNLVTRCGPRANGCNQRNGGHVDGGQDNIGRGVWVNPNYPELVDLVEKSNAGF